MDEGLLPRYPLILSLSKDARPDCPWFDKLTTTSGHDVDHERFDRLTTRVRRVDHERFDRLTMCGYSGLTTSGTARSGYRRWRSRIPWLNFGN